MVSACDWIISKLNHLIELERSRILKKDFDRNTVCDSTVQLGKEAKVFNFADDPKAICIGARSRIMGELLVFQDGGRIEIGEDVFIGPGVRIWSAEHVSIGNRVLISHNVNIFDTDSHPLNAFTRHKHYRWMLEHVAACTKAFGVANSPVNIEEDAWIGAGTSILRGVTISTRSIVGAGSVVTQSIPEDVIAAGNPARVIRSIKNENTPTTLTN
jgi:acetyltransferase-like isoleucine patch superfamily enzyme